MKMQMARVGYPLVDAALESLGIDHEKFAVRKICIEMTAGEPITITVTGWSGLDGVECALRDLTFRAVDEES